MAYGLVKDRMTGNTEAISASHLPAMQELELRTAGEFSDMCSVAPQTRFPLLHQTIESTSLVRSLSDHTARFARVSIDTCLETHAPFRSQNRGRTPDVRMDQLWKPIQP